MQGNLKVFVFSYNRGKYLEHCLNSLKAFLPSHPVTIIDDGSTDRNTCLVLERTKKECEIIHAQKTVYSQKKTGGLYNNMNYALDCAEKEGYKYVLFLQDDQQLLRSIRRVDFNNIDKFFKNQVKSFELHTCFLKGKYLDEDKARMRLCKSGVAFLREDDGGRGNKSFSDSGLFDVERVRSFLGRFEVGEFRNEHKAKVMGTKLGFYRYPFMMWLPFPDSHRGKKRSVYHRMIEMIGKAGFYPYKEMSEGDVNRLFQTPESQLPVAEHCLNCPDAPKSNFWSTEGGMSNLFAHGGSRMLLAKALTKSEKLKSRLLKF